MVIHLVYKFQIIFLMGTSAIEWKLNVGHADVSTEMAKT